MNYKLTEEQSTDFYDKMLLIEDYARNLSSTAVELARSYYEMYKVECSKHWWWREKSFTWFLSTIGNDKGYALYKAEQSSYGFDYLNTRHLSGWVFKTKAKRIAKLTGLDISDVVGTCDVIQRAAWFMFGNSGLLYDIRTTREKFEKYCTVPYTVDEKVLSIIRSMDYIIDYHKIGKDE